MKAYSSVEGEMIGLPHMTKLNGKEHDETNDDGRRG